MINRDATIVVFGRIFTSYGYYMVVPFLMIYLTKHLALSAIDAGVLLAILNLSRRGLGILAGYWSDRFGPRTIILFGLGLEVIAYLTIGWFENFWLLALLIFFYGAGGCLYNLGSRSILAKVKEGKDSSIAFGNFYITMHIGALLGPLTYIWFANTGRIKLTFFLAAIVYAVILVLCFIWLKPESDIKKTNLINLKDLILVFADKPFMIYCSLVTCIWFVLNQFYIVLPLYLSNIPGGEQLLGYLNAWNAILIILIQYGYSRFVGGLNISQKFSLLAVGVSIMGIGWSLSNDISQPLLFLSIGLFTIGEIVFLGVVDLLTLSFAPSEKCGLYLGFVTFTWAVGGALASIFGTLFYNYAKRGHHVEWYWLSLLITSLLLSFFVILAKSKLLSTDIIIPSLQV